MILAEGRWATAVLFGRGDLINPGPHIRNAGRIEAYTTDPAHESVAINTGALTEEFMRLDNSGIIRADIAYSSVSQPGYPLEASDSIYNLAGGEIYGRIETDLGGDQVINRGSIGGDLLMGEGADLVDTINGQLDGIVHLEWGADTFLGSSGDDAVSGGRDADRIEGRTGQDLLFGGLGDDTLIGGGGNDGFYGEHGNDHIVTVGGDRVDGGAGDDAIEARDLTFRSINGGAGLDRLVLAMGADSLDVAAMRASGRATDIEMIEMRGQQRLVVRPGDALGLAGEDTLRLLTTTSDRVELIGAWSETSAVVADRLIYRRFTNAGEIALIAGEGIVTIATAPSAPAGGLDPIAAGSVAPSNGSVPGLQLSSVTTVLNHYDLHDTEVVQSYEIWRSQGGQPVLSVYGLENSLTNHGLIESTGAGNGGTNAIVVNSIDRIENFGTIRATGSGSHHAHGIYGSSHGGLSNYGLIEAVAQAGQATGTSVNNAVWDEINFENYGTISARTDGSAKATGAVVSSDDTATNSGTIAALGGDGSVGAVIEGQRLFTNWGTITADVVAGVSGSATGLVYQAATEGSTFVNRGTIHGDTAIQGDNYGTARTATFYNFGRLEGAVELADGASRFENWGTVVGTVRLGAATNFWFGTGGRLHGSLLGGGSADIMVGSATNDTIYGEAGDDYLRGGRGADRLSGGTGRDVFAYSAVSDSNASAFDTIVDFTSGTDRIDLTALAVQSVSLQAGASFTQVIATTASGALSVRVNGPLVQSDLVLTHASSIQGTTAADVLVATGGGSVLGGGSGVDVLIGSAANDRLEGGAGLDIAWGGAGNDVYVVTEIGDLVWEVTGEGTDLILLDTWDLLTTPDNVENVTLLQAAYVGGNDLANAIRGSSGVDSIFGRGGDDAIDGGGGNDSLVGGIGADRLTGGPGADTFVFSSTADSVGYAARSDGRKLTPDVITDFTSGTDKIRVEDLRFLEGGETLFPAFAFVGTAAFSDRAGEVRYEMTNGDAHIYVDMNGDSIADMHIIANTDILVARDFIF